MAKEVMKSHTTLWIAIIVLAVLVIGSLGYYYGGQSPTPSAPPSGNEQQQAKAPTGETKSVDIQGFAFFPSELTINVGDSVVWNNKDSISHTVVSNNAVFTSRPLKPGETFTFTFDKAGTYQYHCGIHPSMEGTITVR